MNRTFLSFEYPSDIAATIKKVVIQRSVQAILFKLQDVRNLPFRHLVINGYLFSNVLEFLDFVKVLDNVGNIIAHSKE